MAPATTRPTAGAGGDCLWSTTMRGKTDSRDALHVRYLSGLVRLLPSDLPLKTDHHHSSQHCAPVLFPIPTFLVRNPVKSPYPDVLYPPFDLRPAHHSSSAVACLYGLARPNLPFILPFGLAYSPHVTYHLQTSSLCQTYGHLYALKNNNTRPASLFRAQEP